MKKTLIIVAVIFIAITNLYAQRLDVGLAAGFGMSNIIITNSPNIQSNEFSPLISYNFNGYLSYKTLGFWGFTVEPGVIWKGWNMSSDVENFESKIKLNYLQLSVLSDFYLSDKLYFSIGPEMNWLLSAKSKYTMNNDSGTEDLMNFTTFELCGLAAINYIINDNFSIGFRYSHALTQLADDISWEWTGNIEDYVESNDYNQYFQIQLKMRLKDLR